VFNVNDIQILSFESISEVDAEIGTSFLAAVIVTMATTHEAAYDFGHNLSPGFGLSTLLFTFGLTLQRPREQG
jgi:hypothetical protein